MLSRNTVRGPKLAVLVPGPTIAEALAGQGGVPFEEALAIAGDRVLASNKRLGIALSGSEWAIAGSLPFWTGTMTAYAAPGRALGRVLDCEDQAAGTRWLFPVPESSWGEKDAVLVAEHPDYVVERDGRYRIVHAFAPSLVRAFPAENGWYIADTGHGIPQGAGLAPGDPEACYLSRAPSFVGPIARLPLLYLGEEKRRDACVEMKQCRFLGVVVEAPADGLPPNAKALLPEK